MSYYPSLQCDLWHKSGTVLLPWPADGGVTGRMSFPAFPYEPYSIQQEFMEAVYHQLDRGGIGLFESPTGLQPPLYWPCYQHTGTEP